MFDARPVLTSPSLDPVLRLAGLRIDSDGTLHAPRAEQEDVPSPALARTRTWISLWRNLSRPPVVSVRLAVLIAILSVPGPWNRIHHDSGCHARRVPVDGPEGLFVNVELQAIHGMHLHVIT